jgi:hypothetical protein
MKTNIYSKLLKVQTEIGAISKDTKNPFYNSKYFDINSLLRQVMPLLQKQELVLIQPIQDGQVKSVIIDTEGGSVESTMFLPDINDPQKLGSAITYYRRYTLQSLLALQAEDDDGNATVNQVSEVQKDWLNENTPEFSKAIEYIKNGGKIQAIQAKYKLSKKVKEQLLNN